MEYLQSYLDIQSFLGFIAGLFAAYLLSYFKKKGENAATKDDVAEITEKIESVKTEFAQQLNQNSYRYQQEYELLRKLSKRVTEFRDAVRSLRPATGVLDTSKSEDEIVSDRLKKYIRAARRLYKLWEYDRPFYPWRIYNAVKELMDLAHREAVDFQMGEMSQEKGVNYWREADEDSERVRYLCGKVIDSIRERVNKWATTERLPKV